MICIYIFKDILRTYNLKYFRFNGYDGRLDRQLEAVVLLMESFEGHEERFQYDIFGHSGEADALEFVNHSRPPKNEKARLETIKVLYVYRLLCNYYILLL